MNAEEFLEEIGILSYCGKTEMVFIPIFPFLLEKNIFFLSL